MKKICVVTGTRAEWGLLSRLAGMIQADPGLQLQIIATNMHLSPEFGHTYKEIEEAGFRIDRKVPMLLSDDSANATVKSTGLAVIGFADAYETLKPDLLLVLGDRYEILAAVTAALLYRIPVAHLHGGETTEGAYDDAIRHAITKMSHLHFASTEIYRQRIIRMGEQPDTVFNVGSIGVDNIRQLKPLSKEATEASLDGFALDKNTFLVTYHPETLEKESPAHQFAQLLEALDEFPQLRLIFTMPNSDTGGRILMEMIRQWVEKNADRAVWFTSLGQKRYFSVLRYIGGVIGNSSSGIVEVPSFGIPTLDIGNRQKGRIAAESVIHSTSDKTNIIANLLLLLRQGAPVSAENPYDQPDTARKILQIIKAAHPSIQKKFYE